MRRTKLDEFTGGDAIKLAIALYTIKEVYMAVGVVITPRLRRWTANLEEKTRIRKAEETMKKSSSERR